MSWLEQTATSRAHQRHSHDVGLMSAPPSEVTGWTPSNGRNRRTVLCTPDCSVTDSVAAELVRAMHALRLPRQRHSQPRRGACPPATLVRIRMHAARFRVDAFVVPRVSSVYVVRGRKSRGLAR